MQTTKCLFVLVAAVLVVCVSAGGESKEKDDPRPLCFRNATTDERKEKWKTFKTCNESLTEEDRKGGWKSIIKAIGRCTLKTLGLIDDKGVVQFDAMKKRVEDWVFDDHKKPWCDLLDKCKTITLIDDFCKCLKEKKIKVPLPCKCHDKKNWRKWRENREKEGKKGDEKTEDDKKEEESKTEGDIPT